MARKPAAAARASASKAKAAKKPAARKPAAKKPAAKKAVAKKPAARKAAAKSTAKAAAPKKVAAPRRKPAVKDRMNKDKLISEIADKVDLPKTKVKDVLDELEDLMERSLRRRAIGEFQFPGLVKIERYTKKATKKRMGRNLHTGEPLEIPAKRARAAVRFKALTRLKRMLD